MIAQGVADQDRTERRRSVLLSVKECGIGFDPRNYDRLFETFYTTKNDGDGSRLSVQSPPLSRVIRDVFGQAEYGPGATFLFSIPCVTNT